MTSSFRHGVVLTGTVLLVVGTLCFAWWSDGEMALFTGNTSNVTPDREVLAAQASSNAMLRSVSFFGCGVGGLLLLFGLLWSIKENAHTVTERYHYRFPRERHYISREVGEKLTNSHPCISAIPTYEEAANCIPVERAQLMTPTHFVEQENLPPLYETLIGNDWQRGRPKRSLSDSALLTSLQLGQDWHLEPRGELASMFATPPPSYEAIPAHVG